MKISIITVVLNDLEGLKKTRGSIVCQDYSGFEWIVCDGGSDHPTVDYLTSLGDAVTWISEPDGGIYDAMNRGVKMSSGDYVVFMNAGDVFYNDTVLSSVVSVISNGQDEVDILFGGAMLSFVDTRQVYFRPPRLVEKSLWHGLPANHQATYYRRSLLVNNPYDLRYELCGDYYLVARLISQKASPVYIDSPLSVFEVGGNSYRMLKKLFSEPYLIQRDVLGESLLWRTVSFLKRAFSTLGFVVLSNLNFGLKK